MLWCSVRQDHQAKVTNWPNGASGTNQKARQMRKNSLFLLGTVTGICLTLVLSGPQGAHLVAVAKAKVENDVYSQLNLFGEVFERIRAELHE